MIPGSNLACIHFICLTNLATRSYHSTTNKEEDIIINTATRIIIGNMAHACDMLYYDKDETTKKHTTKLTKKHTTSYKDHTYLRRDMNERMLPVSPASTLSNKWSGEKSDKSINPNSFFLD